MKLTFEYLVFILRLSERDSITVSTLACHAADPGSNPAQGDDFFQLIIEISFTWLLDNGCVG